MSLKPLQTHFTGDASLYAPYTSGGGGGGGGPVVVASTLTVSSILGGGPGQTLEFPNGFVLPGGATAQLGGGGGPDIAFVSSNGAITGLSSINGVAYPPPGAQENISVATTTGGYFGDAPVNINPVLAALSVGKWYNVSVELKSVTFVTQPNATDCFLVSFSDGFGETTLGTYNMSQLSTQRGLIGDAGFSVCGPHEAQSTIGAFQYKSFVGAPSTFIVTGNTGWISPLN